MKEEKEHTVLDKSIGRIDVMALGFGTIVGWTWIMLSGEWIKDGGFAGAILAFGICAVVFGLLGTLYGELASALPLTGGEFVYIYRALGPNIAKFIGWIMAFAYIGIAAVEAIALSTAFHYLFPIEGIGYLWTIAGHSVSISWMLPGIIGAVILTLLNYYGMRQAVVFQVIATTGLVLIGFILFFSGIAFGEPKNMGPLFTDSKGLAGVMLAAPTLLIGFSVLAQSSEEMNIPQKSVAKAMIESILLACLWYILVILSCALLAPSIIRDAAPAPLADALAYATGGGGIQKIVIFGGILGILTTWNGFLLGGTRMLFAMGRAKMLPPIFSRRHPVYGTPRAVVLVLGLICGASLLLGRYGLNWLLNLTSLCIMITYLFVTVSYLVLKKREPDLYRPFSAKKGRIISIIVICLISSYLFLYFFLWSGGRVNLYGWLILGLWILVGLVLFYFSSKTYGYISPMERDFLIFGDELSRTEKQLRQAQKQTVRRRGHHEK